MDNYNTPRSVDLECFTSLVAAIIKEAVEDLKRPNYNASAQAFLYGSYFEHLCDLTNLSPQAIRKLAGLKEK